MGKEHGVWKEVAVILQHCWRFDLQIDMFGKDIWKKLAN